MKLSEMRASPVYCNWFKTIHSTS